MSEEIKNTQPNANNATPAATGDQAGGKMFTQEEVNRIVSERLARERENRSAQQQQEDRETALKARESKLDCREFLENEKYPAELLEILDTSDTESFKKLVKKLSDVFGFRKPCFTRPMFTAPKGVSNEAQSNDRIRDAFKQQN